MQEYYPPDMPKEIIEIYEKARYERNDGLAERIKDLQMWREFSRLSKIIFD